MKFNKEKAIEILKKIGVFLKNLLKKIAIQVGKDTFKFIIKCLELVAIFFIFSYFLNWSNDNIVIKEDVYINESIPKSFDGYKILQISDLNGKDVQDELIEKTKTIEPDIIVITGDFISASRTTEYNLDLSYIEEMSKTYPIYFVTGEQEQDSFFYDKLEEKLANIENVTILTNKSIEIQKGEHYIQLMGMHDSSFFFENLTAFNNQLKELDTSTHFTILLSHRPELIDIYTKNDIDLVLSGHALGGQVNIPFVGRLYSNNQGFYPDYTNGFYKQENTTIYVSSGIGNTFIPIRLFNNPEINVITLKCE